MFKTWEVFWGNFSAFVVARDIVEAANRFMDQWGQVIKSTDTIDCIRIVDIDKEMERLTTLCKTGNEEKNKEFDIEKHNG